MESGMDQRTVEVGGGCHCGKVRYEAKGVPVYVPYCHCESCRRISGAPVVLYVMFEKPDVRFTRGRRKIYESSAGVQRGFCPDCGTPLTWEGVWGGRAVTEVHVNTLDDPEAIRPDRHAFFEERLSWFDVHDRLPRFNGSSTNAKPDSFGPSLKSESGSEVTG
jgi:hypothetical protein